MNTMFNGPVLREAAANLEQVMADMSVFTELRSTSAGLGNFDAARQLEGAVNQRRDGVAGNADQLKTSLTTMGQTLAKIVDGFENLDDSNAAKVRSAGTRTWQV
ncbi:DUF2563 family protein [Amycolatopsis jejuensis]|uniref:DUF2563 family protein n=1 Tax=Amycolatopsis jejuensis TaxID=330084 RepID=UPI0005266C6F|nr:DUF2563 family protein [Amycolatopsis jejuensis]